jgi:acetylornithine deacetylase/succinyl-diaminopimelate desuccinylase-like protein
MSEVLAAACRDVDADPIAALTLELAELWSPPGHEGVMAERMAVALDDAGARVRIDREYPGSPSVIASVGGYGGGGPTIQWHGHLDAIDVAHAPPYRTAERVHGRGTADMKGSLAAMVAAVRLLVAHELPGRGRVLVTLHGMHESGGNEPLHALIGRGVHGDAVITGELGGGRTLPIAGLGLAFWRIAVRRPGGAMHENARSRGTVDPLEVGRLLHGELGALRDRLDAHPGEDPKPSLFVASFRSGDYVNRVPEDAVLEGTRRFDGTLTPAEVAGELRALVDRVRDRTGAAIDLTVRDVADSYQVDAAEPIVGATRAAHRALTGDDIPLSRSRLASNAVHFVREAGIPAVGYGPDPATNHSDDESIAVAELPRIAGCFALASELYLAGAGRA